MQSPILFGHPHTQENRLNVQEDFDIYYEDFSSC